MRLMIHGIKGRMGHEIAEVAADQHGVTGLAREEGKLGEMPVTTLDKAEFGEIDAIIDFTLPDGLMTLLPQAVAHRLPLVTGTTGLNAEEQKRIEDASHYIPIVQSYNMSLGVNLLAALVEKAATTLPDDFDIEILEMHHRHKKDAPSGTALLLGEAAATGRGVNLQERTAINRDGERQQGDIGFAVLRGGGVIGDHTVMLAGQSERLELTHKGQDRSIYARGAVKAAQWLHEKPAGMYSMRDVLNI